MGGSLWDYDCGVYGYSRFAEGVDCLRGLLFSPVAISILLLYFQAVE